VTRIKSAAPADLDLELASVTTPGWCDRFLRQNKELRQSGYLGFPDTTLKISQNDRLFRLFSFPLLDDGFGNLLGFDFLEPFPVGFNVLESFSYSNRQGGKGINWK
jgi:hypothetical protein